MKLTWLPRPAPMPCLAARRCTCEQKVDPAWLAHFTKSDPTCIFHRLKRKGKFRGPRHP